MIALGHNFREFKSEEMICRRCGYVIGRCGTVEEAENAIWAIAGFERWCATEEEMRAMSQELIDATSYGYAEPQLAQSRFDHHAHAIRCIMDVCQNGWSAERKVTRIYRLAAQAKADMTRDSGSKPDRATTVKQGVVHESHGAGTAIAQKKPPEGNHP